MNSFNRIGSYLKRYGVVKLYHKAIESRIGFNDHNEARLSEIVTDEELKNQTEQEFMNPVIISILVPVFNTDVDALKQTLNSVKNQSYGNWQLCIADAGDEKRKETIDEIFENDKRVTYIDVCENYGISGNTNKALETAVGQYVAFLDHDDILEPNALFEMMCMIEKGYEIIYSDEDKVSEDLEFYYKPYRKPDFNKNLILSNNYICHFTAIKKSIIDEVGMFRSEYDGAQDYDMILRAIEKTDKIGHIAKILYHWRAGGDSTSSNPFNKEYAFDAGKRAIEDYLRRNNIEGVKVAQMDDPGYYRIRCGRKGNLKVEVVIDGKLESDDCDFYLLLDKNMTVNRSDIDKLLKRAYFTGADIVVPKIITAEGNYDYNGVAKAGSGHTPSLKGKKSWYKGPFNLAVTNMDVHVAPRSGILIKKELYNEVLLQEGYHINALKGDFKGVKMVYAPEATIVK